MIPALTGMGTSFKGAAAYYLHDKADPAAAAAGDHPATSGRVGWTAVLNLPTTDPDRAWRMMAHTALAQGAIKTVAGVMRARIQARAAAFAQREETAAGRMANARALLPTGATPLAIARLAMNAVERLRLFRLRQGRLRRWARQILPSGLAATLPVRSAPVDRMTARRDHDAAALRQLQAMETRHAAERRQERETRAALQRQAAQAWRTEAGQARMEPAVARYAGYGVAHWQAAQRGANDNRRAPPPSPRPRPF